MNDKKVPLVSILTPCYNGEQYIKRYVTTLLEQDYCACQLIFMNDGSTDDTEQQILTYEKKFLEKGFTFEYYYHENKGVGATIAEGIKYVKGDYLIWPDIDDTMATDAISRKVEFLEKNLDCGSVRTAFNNVLDSDEKTILFVSPSSKYKVKENLFMDCLTNHNVWFQPGSYMIRVKDYDKVNPQRLIYPSRIGQNWQMLLPIFYCSKCGYIDEPLFTYFIHKKSSLSCKNNVTIDEKFTRYNECENVIMETLKVIKIDNFEYYKHLVHNRFLEMKMFVAYDLKNKEVAKLIIKEQVNQKYISVRSLVKYIFLILEKN